MPSPLDFIMVVIAVLIALAIRDFWKDQADEEDYFSESSDERQTRAYEWAEETYGDRVDGARYQAFRALEEMLELAQAEGLSLDDVNRTAGFVFVKKVGDAEEELGDLLLSLNIMAETKGLSADDLLDETLDRVEDLDQERCLAKDELKVKAGLI